MTSSIVDGEAVIINLDTGNYYSSAGIGAEIWARIGRRQGKASIVQELQKRYSDSVSDVVVSKAVDRFFSLLETEGLIELSEEAGASQEVPVPLPESDSQIFEEPALFRYDDMNELLLLDPIHDVDESGWPKTPETLSEEQKKDER